MPSNLDMSSYIIDHLDEALESGWVRAYYQPVIRTVTGKVCGMEALARWEDPTYGLLPPCAFISPLEQAKLIHKLDSYMVDQVCRQLRASKDEGIPVVPVSFNLSRLDFDLCDITAIIEDTVHAYEVPRNYVNIEITESVFGADPSFMATVIDQFHGIGYQVWMDDFGSAYSSLNVLKDFDFDEIKIDFEFLSRFGEKSRTIVASVVDMAKRLNIQTLAEGVETPAHAEFLRHIGCEKQQGYLYDRPQPYSVELMRHYDSEYGIEHQDERHYYRTVGSVNTLNLSERDFLPDNKTKDYVTSMPLAFVEYDADTDVFSVLDCNDSFIEALNALGVDEVSHAERFINDKSRLPARTWRRMVESIPEREFVRHDSVYAGQAYVMRAKHVASFENRTTVLVSLSSAIDVEEQRRHARLEAALGGIMSIYEHVDVLHLDEGISEPAYVQSNFKQLYDLTDLDEAVRQFANNEIYPGDRQRYREFMDTSTLVERIKASGQHYIVGFFRVRDRGGEYVWKLFLVIHTPTGASGNEVMVCIRDTHWANDALLQMAFEQGEDEISRLELPSMPDLPEMPDLHITDGSLWRAIAKNSLFGLFWKDTDRRFVGCNDKFLEYYGFNSVDDIVGKTDEDMGWHVNPIPFMQDELRVLREGISTKEVHGQCIVHGEIREIVASKHPIYRNGHIVGLMGYFIDVSDAHGAMGDAVSLPYIDSVTDMMNYGGVDAAAIRYIEAYERTGADFAAVAIDLDNFKYYNDQYGYDFGDKVLREVAQVIKEIVGVTGVTGHLYASRFVVLRQGASHEDMMALGKDIVKALSRISLVDGVRVTLYAQFSVVLYSETGNLDDFKHESRSRLHDAQKKYRKE